jgi:uncharacterized membrane protein
MVLMALDHVRDFFHSGAMSFSPTDLTRTSPILFLTRWITHFCLPVFMFTAGTGAFLWWRRGNHTRSQLSRFLWTRGLWFVLLELTVMQLAYNFNISPRYLVLLLILWIFGVCMILMAALIYLPMSWLLVSSLAAITLHNCLDRFTAAQFGAAAWFWQLLHQPGIFTLGGKAILVTYTLLPWIAVMATGFCFGQTLNWEPPARRRLTTRMGFVMVIAFLVLRAVNLYGDPAPWSFQKTAALTVLSFFNCTKYPASLDFLLMTLGPALLALAWLDRHAPNANNPLLIFGRVPLFYFVLHFFLIHSLAVLMAWLRYGKAAFSFMFNPLPSMGGPRELFPRHFGYNLLTTYAVWILIVLCLYPLCRKFAQVKSTQRKWWLSYL